MDNSTIPLQQPDTIAIGSVDIEQILKKYDPHIIACVKKHFYSLSSTAAYSYLDLDDLIQQARFKLWQKLTRIGCHNDINNIEAYISSICYTVCIDPTRKKQHLCCRFPEEEGVLESSLSRTVNQDIYNPAHIFEEKEGLAEKSALLARCIRTLPLRQREALLWSLREDIEGTLILRMFVGYDFQFSTLREPSNKLERSRMLASLSVARKKLRKLYKEATAC